MDDTAPTRLVWRPSDLAVTVTLITTRPPEASWPIWQRAGCCPEHLPLLLWMWKRSVPLLSSAATTFCAVSGARDDADVTVTVDRARFNDVILGQTTLPEQIAAGTARIDGNAAALHEFIDLLDRFEF